MNPYELGKYHAENNLLNENPFPEYSGKWALYNKGYNETAYPWMKKHET